MCLLLLLRHAKVATDSQPPLIIAHSLLGDHKGYARLWNVSLKQKDVYALAHRGLSGAETFALDREGANSMVSEYAHAAQMAFASTSFNMIGASFGAVLASHVVHTARAIGCHPCRVILVDPPPAVPRELPLPRLRGMLLRLQQEQRQEPYFWVLSSQHRCE